MEQPKRRQNRLPEFDYGAPGAYFVTICTDKREKLFWENVGAAIARPEDVRLSAIGEIAKQSITEISTQYPAFWVDIYSIMPDHVHLLIQIVTDDSGRPMVAPTISTAIQQLKGAVTKKAKRPVWQKGFYDHVVRSEEDYREVWAYIEGNPMKWEEDHR